SLRCAAPRRDAKSPASCACGPGTIPGRAPRIRVRRRPRPASGSRCLHRITASVVDTSTAGAFLKEHFGAIANVQAVGHGEWSKAFYFTRPRDQRDMVVRFSAIDDDFRKDQRVQTLNLNPTHVRMPKLLEIGQAFDGYFAISERAHGTFLEERD